MIVLRRELENPLLSPRHEHPWESVAAYNPSVIKEKEGWRMFYRALSSPDALVTPYAGQSTIGEAYSKDGIHFTERRQVLIPEEPWDAHGLEDPRATLFEGALYLSYTALGGYPFSKDNIKAAVAIARDGEHFIERHLVTPFNAKAFTLFPERVNGKVAALLTVHTDDPPAEICLALADEVEDFWSPRFWEKWYADWRSHTLPFKRSDRDHVEVGSVPVLTNEGWLIFYSYIENYFNDDRVFSIEAALLDSQNPSKILSRTGPLMVPEDIYEHYGLVPHIIFPTSVTVSGEQVELWYGAADTVCAKASVRLTDILATLTNAKDPLFTRGKTNPILLPQGTGFESRDVFNPAAIELNGSIYILYRAMDSANTSTIGLAISKDGLTVDERLPSPMYSPRASFEMKHGSPTGNSGCEDPRIVRMGNTLYMTYTAYDGVHAPLGALTSIAVEDFLARRWDKWEQPTLLTPDGVDDKDLALLPEKIDDQYLLYHRISNQICADTLPELSSGKRVDRCIEIMGPRHGMWDGVKVGSALPPLKTPEGNWLMIYHGVSRDATYALGAALLDPSGLSVLARAADPIFEPTEAYEQKGEIANVVFACGGVVRDDTLFLYYGGADKVVGVATASLSRILKALS